MELLSRRRPRAQGNSFDGTEASLRTAVVTINFQTTVDRCGARGRISSLARLAALPWLKVAVANPGALYLLALPGYYGSLLGRFSMNRSRGFFLLLVAMSLLVCPSLLEGQVRFSEDTEHWYEAVVQTTNWSQAKLEAESRGGHLATVTSASENQFVLDRLLQDSRLWTWHPEWNKSEGPWLGGYQAPGSAEPSGGWSWVTGETWSYAPWRDDEPSNSGDEKYLQYGSMGQSPQSTWNDKYDTTAKGYVVEYAHAPGQAASRPQYSSDTEKWYQVFTVPQGLSWSAADAAAKARGGHLATITSPAENDFVKNLGLAAGIQSYGGHQTLWLGGFQPPGSDEPSADWQWVTGEEWTYTNWVVGNPSNGPNNNGPEEDSLEMCLWVGSWWSNYLGKWNDMYTDVLLSGESFPIGYVIEYESNPSPPKANMNKFCLTSADATQGNSGPIGMANLSKTYAEVTDTSVGNIIFTRSPYSDDSIQVGSGEVHTPGITPKSLLGQMSYLYAPTTESLSSDTALAWSGRSGSGSALEDVIERERRLVCQITGSFVLDEDAPNISVRLRAEGLIASYTMPSLSKVNVSEAARAFDVTKHIISVEDARALKSLEKGIASLGASLTVELVMDPVSRYAGAVYGRIQCGSSVAEGRIIDSSMFSQGLLVEETDGFCQNLAAFYVGEDSAEFQTTGRPGAAGEPIEWSAEFTTSASTYGYAWVKSLLTGYVVDVMADDQVIGTVTNSSQPLPMPEVPAPLEVADLLSTSGETTATDRPQDLFNNMFMEFSGPSELTSGSYQLVEGVGSVKPTDGDAFALIGQDSGVSGFVTLLNLPAGAESMAIDYILLADAAMIPDGATLAVCAWDEKGHISVVEVCPEETALAEILEPEGTFSYSSSWLSAELDLRDMEGIAYFAAFLDCEAGVQPSVAVGLDNVRTYGTPVPEPTSLCLLALSGLVWVRRSRA